MAENETPNPGTKAALEADNERLTAENERLKGELAAARAGAASPAQVTMSAPAVPGRPAFGLSEGERQALIMNGVVNSAFDGSLILASDHGIEPVTEIGRKNLAHASKVVIEEQRKAIRGVDFVYPSAAPGVLAEGAEVRGAQPADAVNPDQV